MPLYATKCDAGHIGERFVSLSKFNEPMAPCECGELTWRVVTAPHIMASAHYDYQSVIDGTNITSREAHRDHLARHNMIEIGNEVPKPHVEKPFDWKSAIGETYAELKVTGKIDD
jgi:hypothetical protein